MMNYKIFGVLGIVLTGCAGIKGTPSPTVKTEDALSALNAYLKVDVLTKSDSTNPKDRNKPEQSKVWRDTIIDARITIADLYFRDFTNDLHSQGTSFNILSDFAVLGMSAAGALASGGTTNVLAAASAGVTGARGAVDKDIYYRETLPGLIRTMEANRKEILVGIKTKMKSHDASQYSLGDALYDLQRYENAGTLNSALSTITGKADEAANTADETLSALFTATIVPEDVNDRKVKLADYIRGLKSNDKTTLDKIAKLIKIAVTPDMETEREFILDELNKRINSVVTMDEISGQLKELTNEAF
ncbi:MAG: hypothetical protein PHR16_14420 [Methylovulum sp.]|nr:hypothetical protein [Methylovulum sp.]